MAQEVFAVIGSGTIPQTHSILPPAQRGTELAAQGIRKGTQVMLANPEDLNSVEAFAASGITVGTSAVEILAPGSNPLPRMREVTIQNLGTADVYIGHSDSVNLPIEGIELTAPAANTVSLITIPLLHNVSVWAATLAGTADVRLLIY
jgi:hypothetical protein